MSIPMPNRKKQITAKIRATSNPQSVDLYTPSSVSLLGTQVNYNGDMARIRVFAVLNSLPEVYVPIILPTDTNAQKEQKNNHFRSQPKIGLMAYLVDPGGEKFEVGLIDCYNVQPNFLTGVSEFFSDLELYGIQYGYKISVEVVDRGFGLLKVNENQPMDFLSITGFALEKSEFLQGNDNVIYNFVV